ncbi:hypothetical protein GKZ75_02295 [Kocuria indica]|uniref:DUF1648 domain-containing protein n=1 Tax=Kocuria marina subsp. indica TaxID=1049583 RepID=A0A6N9QV77_9MICC|nr:MULTISPECIES: hypothetical protein [Kocuria]MCT1616621.1 hypothetical protein [Kocuria marina]NDO77095.1 hypothetical protein [Kocuria indica]
MSERKGTREPIRNHDGDAVYTSFSERPPAEFMLDLFHRALLVISVVLAAGLPVYFLLWARGIGGPLPMQYGVDGEVTREGSPAEAVIVLSVLGITTIGLAVLTRYPRIFNFPFMLTEHNVQRQYKNAVQMLVWVAAGMALLEVVMIGVWMGVLSENLFWIPVAAILGSTVVFIVRMFKLR